MIYEIKKQQDETFIIKETPNIFLTFLRLSKCIERRYKICGEYAHFDSKAVLREDGQILSYDHPIVKLINNHLRKF